MSDLWVLQKNSATGFANAQEFYAAVLASNPSITNVNQIQAGQTIYLPEKLSTGSITYNYAGGASINNNAATGEYYMSVPNAEGGQTIYSRTYDGNALGGEGYTVRQVSTNGAGVVTFDYTGRQATLADDITPIGAHWKNSKEEGIASFGANGKLANETVSALDTSGSPTQTSTTTQNPDGTYTVIRSDSSGAVLSTATMQIFDDGSGISNTTYPDGHTELLTSNNTGAPSNLTVTTPGANNTETVTSYSYIDGKPVWQSSKAIEYFYDDNGGVSKIETTSYADGRVIKSTYDTDGQLFGQETIASPTSPLVSALKQYGSPLIDALTMLKAIQSGQPLPVVTSGLRLAVDLTSVNDPQYYNLAGAASVGSGILSLMSLDAALERGDGIAAITAGAQTLSFAATAYVDFASSQAFNALNNGTINLGAESAMLEGMAVAESVGKVLPGLNLVNSLAHGDSVGSAVALVSMVPGLQWVGVAYSVFNMVSSLFGHRDPPPEAWGGASATWSGFDTVANAYGANGGQATASSYMNQFIAQLDALAAREQLLNPNSPIGVVANRLPSFSYRNYSGFTLTDIDPLTGVQTNTEVRYDLTGHPFNAPPGSEVGAQSFAERFLRVALERGAIAPLWEAETAAIQTQYGDPQAGLTEEERAGRNGLLAKQVTGDSQFWRPVALDLNGNGIETTGALRSVAFDMDDSGFLKNTAWLAGGDGFLFLDRNLNGGIDTGRELFSNGMLDISARGLAGMRWVDSNYDGSLTAADPVWDELKVWVDANGDGQAEAGEARGLSVLGISSLNYAMGTFEQNGVLKQLASPDLAADTQGMRTHVVPEGIVVETSQGQISLLTTHIDDRSLLEANRDGVTSYEDMETIISTADLRANDTLAGWLGQDLTVTGVANFTHGSGYLDANGFVHYRPDANYYGPASFNYTLQAPTGQTVTATVDLTLKNVNDAPTATVDQHVAPIYGYTVAATYDDFGNYSGPSGPSYVPYYGMDYWNATYGDHSTPISYVDLDGPNGATVVAHDIDDPNGSFTYSVVQQPQQGAGYVDANGNISYTNWYGPNTPGVQDDGQTNSDPFIVRVTDPHGAYTDVTVNTVHQGAYYPNLGSGGGGKKPIAVDLDANGFQFTKVDDSNVFFDVNGDGWKERMAWTAPGDGLLAFDANGDGKIDQVNEISFASYLHGAQTDLEGLKAFDSNGDGVFNAADEKWGKFGVWQDANQNGVTDPGEFRTLADLGVAAVNLSSDGQFSVIDGQTVHGIGSMTMEDGSTRALADVTLEYSSSEVLFKNPDGTTRVLTRSPFSPSGENINGTEGNDLILGKNGNNIINAYGGDDVIFEDGGNDVVDAGDGNDIVYSGADNDVVMAGAGNDVVYAGLGNDLVLGGDGEDALFGEAGNDIVFGGDGNDLISGDAGNDVLSGDFGDDMVFGGSGNDALFGMEGNDQLGGSSGYDYLNGGDGNDLLDGGSEADTMLGGTGDDSYAVDNVDDVVVENPNEGSDTVRASISYALGDNVENLTLTGADNLVGLGNGLDNVLIGNSGNNQLTGGAGNDTLNGGLGTDTLIGGTGDDTYVVDNAGDQVIESSGEGVDTVRAGVSYALGDNLENLTLTGMADLAGTGNAADNVLLGNGGNNRLDGGAGVDQMAGGLGDDTYVVDNAGDTVVEGLNAGYDTIESSVSYVLPDNVERLILTGAANVDGTGNGLDNVLFGNDAVNQLTGLGGNDQLFGNGGDDTLIGGDGNDVLDGGAGSDAMLGGSGDDSYYVDNVGDQVIEAASAGTDQVFSTISYVLPENVENLTLLGTENIDGAGNNLDNVLIGSSGNNHLNGGAGADKMAGSLGDDTYVVDNAGDTVLEGLNEGYDTIESSVSYVLPDNVERLILTGTTNIDGTGNGLDNVLIGNSGNNRLTGLDGNDTLTGNGGNDALDGGAGNDTYVWANGDGLDTVSDLSGIDVMQFGEGLTVDNLALRVTALNGVYTAHVRALDANGCEMDGQGLDFTVTRNASGDFVSPLEEFRLADGTLLNFNDLLIDTIVTGDPKHGDWFHGDDWRDESNQVINPMGKFQFADASNQTLGQFLDAAREDAHHHDWYDDDEHGHGWQGWSEWRHGGWHEWHGRPSATSNNIVTGRDDDIIFASQGMDTVHAGTGNDVIFGREGADALYGEGGNDAIFGSSGADVLDGGYGYDILVGGNGADVLRDPGHNNLMLGGSGNDLIEAGNGNDFIAGGRDNDTIRTGGGRNVVAFNRNDGKDTILASAGAQNTLSLGEDIDYDDMNLSRNGDDLVLDMKHGDAVTFKDWYSDTANRNFLTLQIMDESREWHHRHDWHGRDPFDDNKVEVFDFQKLVNQFDTLAATGVTRWNLMNGLLDAHLESSDDAAIGGEFAFQYAKNTEVRDLGIATAQDVMKDASFGALQKGLQPFCGLGDEGRGGRC